MGWGGAPCPSHLGGGFAATHRTAPLLTRAGPSHRALSSLPGAQTPPLPAPGVPPLPEPQVRRYITTKLLIGK